MFHYFGFPQPLDVPYACGTFKKPVSSIGSVGSLVDNIYSSITDYETVGGSITAMYGG